MEKKILVEEELSSGEERAETSQSFFDLVFLLSIVVPHVYAPCTSTIDAVSLDRHVSTCSEKVFISLVSAD